MIRSLQAAVGVAVLAAGAATAQQPLVLTDALLIDGRGGAPVAGTAIVVQGDRITAVGPAGAVALPAGARVVDVGGSVVMPGLTDAHVHLVGGWDGVTVDLLGYRRYLDALLYAGVTTVLDVGNVLPYVQQMRQELATGRLTGPRIHMAGALIDGPSPFWPPISFAVTSDGQLTEWVTQLEAAGVDFLKAYGGLTDERIAAVAAEGRARSLPVIVDAHARNGSAELARAGITAFAHAGNRPITDEALALMRERGVAAITTLTVYESFARRRLADLAFLDQPLLAGSLPPAFRADLEAFARDPAAAADSAGLARGQANFRTAMANVRRMRDAGILLVAGTDSPYPGVFFGEALHRELELLVEAGLAPLEAIAAATSNAPRLLGQTGWGVIEPGARADLLVIDGRPDLRIAESRRITMVVQAGRLLDRDALRFDPARDPGFRATDAAISSND